MNFQPTVIPNAEDHLSANAIFSGIKRTIFSKDFKGGKVSNVFGSTELDFSHADLKGMAVLDISQAFGETTITVPDDWHVKSDISQLFAAVDDYRNDIYNSKRTDKILILKGGSFCASIEVHNC